MPQEFVGNKCVEDLHNMYNTNSGTLIMQIILIKE